jgi:purine-binding chemotaxis protein CheW
MSTLQLEPHTQTQSRDDIISQLLTFKVDGEDYGVDIMQVREVKGWTDITRLPNSHPYMRGVINLRGLVIPIYDLRTCFGNGVTEATEKHVIIILGLANRTVGILVDAVSDILTIESGDIKEAPANDNEAGKRFIAGLIAVDEHMVVLLNMEQLLADSDASALTSSTLDSPITTA